MEESIHEEEMGNRVEEISDSGEDVSDRDATSNNGEGDNRGELNSRGDAEAEGSTIDNIRSEISAIHARESKRALLAIIDLVRLKPWFVAPQFFEMECSQCERLIPLGEDDTHVYCYECDAKTAFDNGFGGRIFAIEGCGHVFRLMEKTFPHECPICGRQIRVPDFLELEVGVPRYRRAHLFEFDPVEITLDRKTLQVIRERPWLITPHEYELKCIFCNEVITPDNYSRGVVGCSACDRSIPVDLASEGTRWTYCDCGVTQLIPINGTRKCRNCGTNDSLKILKTGVIKKKKKPILITQELINLVREKKWMFFQEEYEVQCRNKKCLQWTTTGSYVRGLVYCEFCSMPTPIEKPSTGALWARRACSRLIPVADDVTTVPCICKKEECQIQYVPPAAIRKKAHLHSTNRFVNTPAYDSDMGDRHCTSRIRMNDNLPIADHSQQSHHGSQQMMPHVGPSMINGYLQNYGPSNQQQCYNEHQISKGAPVQMTPALMFSQNMHPGPAGLPPPQSNVLIRRRVDDMMNQPPQKMIRHEADVQQ